MKDYFTYDRQEAEDFKKYLEAQGRKVRIAPIAEDFRKIGDTRPVKTKYYIKDDIFSGYAGDVLR